MVTIKVEIRGRSPLLQNRFTDEAQLQVDGNKGRSAMIGRKGNPKDQAAEKLYLGSNGKPMVPGPNMFRCLIDAGIFFKSGRSKLTTQKSSLIPACVEIEEIEIPIVSEGGWTVDTRPVRIPATGGRILCHRPRFDDWRLAFTLIVDTDMLDPALLRDIVDAAGKRIGLADFRPANKGPFGRFLVDHWKEVKAVPAMPGAA